MRLNLKYFKVVAVLIDNLDMREEKLKGVKVNI